VRPRSQASHQAVILNPSKGSLQLNLHTGVVLLLYPVIPIWYDWTAFHARRRLFSRRHWLGGVVNSPGNEDRFNELGINCSLEIWGQVIVLYCTVQGALTLCGVQCAPGVIDGAMNI